MICQDKVLLFECHSQIVISIFLALLAVKVKFGCKFPVDCLGAAEYVAKHHRLFRAILIENALMKFGMAANGLHGDEIRFGRVIFYESKVGMGLKVNCPAQYFLFIFTVGLRHKLLPVPAGQPNGGIREGQVVSAIAFT